MNKKVGVVFIIVLFIGLVFLTGCKQEAVGRNIAIGGDNVGFGGDGGIEGYQTVVQCGDTITSNVKLTENLDCGEEEVFIIGANDITLDCNGHSISGGGDLIYIDRKERIEIKNCDIYAERSPSRARGMYIAFGGDIRIINNNIYTEAGGKSEGIYFNGGRDEGNIVSNSNIIGFTEGIRVSQRSAKVNLQDSMLMNEIDINLGEESVVTFSGEYIEREDGEGMKVIMGEGASIECNSEGGCAFDI